MKKKVVSVLYCDFIHDYNLNTGVVSHTIKFHNLESIWNQFDSSSFQIEHFEQYRSDLAERIKLNRSWFTRQIM